MSSDHRPVFASFRLGVIQQFAAKVSSSATKQDDVIIIFQTCEAEVSCFVDANGSKQFFNVTWGKIEKNEKGSYYYSFYYFWIIRANSTIIHRTLLYFSVEETSSELILLSHIREIRLFH
jgi:hypothetical protein